MRRASPKQVDYDLRNAKTGYIPTIRDFKPVNELSQTESTLDSQDYVSYARGMLIILVCILTALVALTVVEFWGATQTAQMNQLQQCMSRINPDPNTNYQLETYKCMNGK